MSDPAPPLRLPARPSLDQLRKQAKELLRRLRDGDSAAAERVRAYKAHFSDATLADAQYVLAREYGFESWAKLAQHVQAMQPAIRTDCRSSSIWLLSWSRPTPRAISPRSARSIGAAGHRSTGIVNWSRCNAVSPRGSHRKRAPWTSR